MKNLSNYEGVARWLCQQQGENPDQLIYREDTCAMYQWQRVAEELQKHDMMNETLERKKRIDTAENFDWRMGRP